MQSDVRGSGPDPRTANLRGGAAGLETEEMAFNSMRIRST